MVFDRGDITNPYRYHNPVVPFFENNGFRLSSDYTFSEAYTRFIFKRSFLKENQIIFPSYRRRQDPVFLFNALDKASRYYALTEIVYLYRVSHKKVKWDYKKFEDALDSFNECIPTYIKNGYSKHIVNDYNELRTLCDLIKHTPTLCRSEKKELFAKAKNIENLIPFHIIPELKNAVRLEKYFFRQSLKEFRRWFISIRIRKDVSIVRIFGMYLLNRTNVTSD